MTTISRDDITYIAHLARLETDPDKAEAYAAQLNRILQLIDAMNRIDTDRVEPMSHPQDGVLRLRPDEVTAQNRRDEYQQIAPAMQDGFYLVPAVLD